MAVSNRLAASTSPYLQQHADNPVDWWEWSPEAFAEAARRDVPVLLSVGYASCHWCHVMAHESFEDPGVARYLNEHFVAIKVDRELRPDIDTVYLRATQLLAGGGGWPMTVFLDHEGRPFHAGTYYPPEDRHGMPSFGRVLHAISDAWRTDRERVGSVAQRVAAAIRSADDDQSRPAAVLVPAAQGGLDRAAVADRAVGELSGTFDAMHGGFGSAPKFPPSTALEFLLRHHARTGSPISLTMAEATCEAMARGGMYDQLGGGFSRYSVDVAWVVPHFEKMLYDNALLARVYLHLWRLTGSPLARRVAGETCDFLLQDLRTPEGGFASSLDADSDPVLPGQHREGAHYVWTQQQLHDALGLESAEVARWLDVGQSGTFEHGSSVLQLRSDPPEPAAWQGIRQRLLQARRTRPAPARDDKVLSGWNGLAIAALAEAGLLLERPDLLDAARTCAGLLLDVHVVDGSLRRGSRDGGAAEAQGVIEDYGGVAEGLVTLYQATGELRWLDAAQDLLHAALDRFADGSGGFFDTAADAEPLVTRPRDPVDVAVPSGWSLVTGALLTVAALTGDTAMRASAEASLDALLRHPAAAHPRFFGWSLAVLEAALAGPVEVAVIGEPGDTLHRAALAGTSPGMVVAVGPSGSDRPALLAGRAREGNRPTAYVCRDFTCRAPTTDPIDLRDQVRSRSS